MFDEYFMREALKEARKAFDLDEVPVGCVIVKEKKIIARGYNRVESLKDATAHAEILCIGAASENLNNWRLLDTTLYCTLEPCIMCVGAIFAARISRVVWSSSDNRLGGGGGVIDLFSLKHPFHEVLVEKGLLKEESENLLKDFFKRKREKN